MPQINVHIDEERFNKFRETKILLKSKTNEEAIGKIIELVYKQLKKLTSRSTS